MTITVMRNAGRRSRRLPGRGKPWTCSPSCAADALAPSGHDEREMTGAVQNRFRASVASWGRRGEPAGSMLREGTAHETRNRRRPRSLPAGRHGRHGPAGAVSARLSRPVSPRLSERPLRRPLDDRSTIAGITATTTAKNHRDDRRGNGYGYGRSAIAAPMPGAAASGCPATTAAQTIT